MFQKLAVSLLSLISVTVFANTNFNVDSYDIYEYNITGDTTTEIIFIAKEKILLIAGDVSIPIKYKDGDDFYLTGNTIVAGRGGFNPSGKTKTTRFSIIISDANGDGINDMLLKPTSGTLVQVNGGTTKLPSSASSSSTFAGFENDGNTTFTPVSTPSGQAYKVARNGVTFFVDSEGNPYNISKTLASATAVGNLKGNFTVSQGGAATYSLPIDLVPGPAGIRPNVSVSYYSQGGNGLLGKGWSLSATESITRCKAPGRSKSVPSYSTTDTFCLNGDPLVAFTADGQKLYRKRIDDGTLLKFNYAANQFSAVLENGTKRLFSSHLNRNASGTNTKSWYLTRETQLGGAYSTYDYSFDHSNGEALLTSIQYGSHSVSFYYEERPDRSFAFDSNGSKVNRTKRLSSISTNGTGENIATYSFKYGYNSRLDQSFLTDIQKCVGSSCYEELTFAWNQPSNTIFESTEHSETLDNNYDTRISFGDIDGNGTTDIIGFEKNSDWKHRIKVFKSKLLVSDIDIDGGTRLDEVVNAPQSADYQLMISDLDGDGIDDIFWYNGNRIQTYNSNGKFGFGNANQTRDTWDYDDSTLIDVNGDGLTDLVHSSGAMNAAGQLVKSETFAVYLGDGSGSFTGSPKFAKRNDETHFAFADINGDNKADVIMLHDDGTLEYRYSTSSQTSVSFSNGGTRSFTSDNKKNFSLTTADINGDGLADVVISNKLGYVSVYLSNGNSLSSAPLKLREPWTYDEDEATTASNKPFSPQFQDINGDGRTDMVIDNDYRPGQIDGLFGPRRSINLPAVDLRNGLLTFVDINGDGAKDAVAAITNRSSFADNKVKIRKGTSPDLSIARINDSYENQTSIDYKNMTDAQVYQRSTPAWFRDGISISLNPATKLVYKTNTSEGDTYFKYGGAQSSLDEGYLGFQLFSSVTGRESQDAEGAPHTKSIIAVTYLDQRDYLVGKPRQVYKRVKNGSSESVFAQLKFEDKEGTVVAAYGASNVALLDTRALSPRNGITGSTGVGVGEGASTFISEWTVKTLTTGIVRPVLASTANTYFDPEDGNTILARTITSNDWEVVGPALVTRPTYSETTEGLDKTVKSVRRDFEVYDSVTGSNNPDYLINALHVVKEKVTTTALGDWKDELVNNSLATTDFYYVNRSYGSNNLLYSQYISDREDDWLNTTFFYDTRGQLTKQIVSNKTTPTFPQHISRVSEWKYDADTGFLLWEKNAAGHYTVYENYDKYGNPGKVTVGVGSPESLTQALSTVYTYDKFGRQTKVTSSAGQVAETSYHNCAISLSGCIDGKHKTLIKTKNYPGTETYQYYDKRGLNTKTITSHFKSDSDESTTDYVVTTTEYDKHQRVVSTTAPRVISFLDDKSEGEARKQYYDVFDQSVRVEDGAGGITKTIWDYQGNGVNQRTVKVLVDGTSNYRDTVETYNALNQLVKVKAPNGSYTQFLYDLNGNVVRQWYSKANYSVTTPEANTGIDKNQSHVIVKTYDKRSRLLSEIDPDKGETVYEYTPFGEVKTVKTPRAIAGAISAQTFAYDLLGRQTRTTNNDGSACYFYDESSNGPSVGQLTETRYYKGSSVTCNPSAKVEGYYAQQVYKYDSKGRLLDHDQFISGAGSFDATYTYTATGQPLTKAWTGGNGGSLTVTYGYDSHTGILKTVKDGSKTHWTLTDVDALGNATGVTLGSGNKVIKNYNANTGRMADVAVTSNTGTYASYLNYTYNKAGFVTNMTESAFLYNSTYSETYHYDDIAHRQLTSVDVTTGGSTNAGAFVYQYDALGNIRSSKQMGAYAYTDATAPHRVTTVNGKTYVYGNNDGNVTNDGRRSLIYGHNHLPTRISQGSGSSLRQSEYVYGADNGLLYRKDSVGTTVSQENWYFGDMQLTKKAGLTEKVYTIAEGVTLVIDAGSGAQKEAQYSVTNNIGSTHIVLDENGFTKQRIMYDPFGKPNKFYTSSASTSIQDWSGFASKEGFTGHEHMYELDLIHMKGRVYDPTIGRFLQADLVVQAPGQILSYNRYAYVWNNPGAYTDPSGYVCGCPADRSETGGAYDSTSDNATVNPAGQPKDTNAKKKDDNVGKALNSTSDILGVAAISPLEEVYLLYSRGTLDLHMNGMFYLPPSGSISSINRSASVYFGPAPLDYTGSRATGHPAPWVSFIKDNHYKTVSRIESTANLLGSLPGVLDASALMLDTYSWQTGNMTGGDFATSLTSTALTVLVPEITLPSLILDHVVVPAAESGAAVVGAEVNKYYVERTTEKRSVVDNVWSFFPAMFQ
ncbi:FG-GAP-like repeat-containing protein [Reinekea sp. G2M2-21]|uniref:FG-GAP-like repeat-containing protein n=1 Tax=Reinekea sp. G2M2-21 TaxID=2788942 RepID=UPI0018A89FA9|nr:FG-GAP-like repeat-containing protein [Reinekea sp. G2M2-21]